MLVRLGEIRVPYILLTGTIFHFFLFHINHFRFSIEFCHSKKLSIKLEILFFVIFWIGTTTLFLFFFLLLYTIVSAFPLELVLFRNRERSQRFKIFVDCVMSLSFSILAIIENLESHKFFP